MPQSKPSEKISCKKEKIPYEIKNAREWDMNKDKTQYPSNEESEDDYDEEEDDFIHRPYISGGRPLEETTVQNVPSNVKTPIILRTNGKTPNGVMDDGFQHVTHKRTSRLPTRFRDITAVQGQSRRKPNLGFIKDNPARAAYRKRLPHDAIFRFPKDCDQIFPIRRKMYDLLEELGVRYRTFIRPPQHVKDRDLFIWGSHAQVQKTMAELTVWLKFTPKTEITKPKGKECFATEVSTIGGQWKHHQNKLLKQAAIQDFQRVPEDGRLYAYTGTFLWPIEEVRPEELLGESLEALDPIRFEYKCHIVFDNRLSAFRVFTDNSASVTRTMLRITGIMREYTAKYTARNSRQIVDYVVKLPSLSAMRKDIKILPGSTTCKIPLLTGDVLEPHARDSWLENAKGVDVQNDRRIEQDLRKAILILPYYRGNVRMRIQYGTFGLTTLKWPERASSMPFPDFMTNLALPATKGILLRDLQIRKDTDTIMNKVYRATDLLEPLSHSTCELKYVSPSFGARFTFQESGGPIYQLDVEMSSDFVDEGIYEKTQAIWTRGDGRDNRTLLGVYKVQLDGGSSWMLRALTETAVDKSRINPRMEDFANSVKLKKVRTAGFKPTGHKMFCWEKDLPGAMRPISFEQKTSYRYRLVHNTDCVFEFARYDIYADPKDENTPTHSSWTATLCNGDWDSTLGGNLGLGIGQSADWIPRLATFFPGHGASANNGLNPGVADFLSTVKKVTDFLDDLKKEPPHLQR